MDFQVAYFEYVKRSPTKYEALYQAIKAAIMEGRLAYGIQLPSTRELAKQYSLSRGTVNVAYEMLAAEGYTSSETGKGTFVAKKTILGGRAGGSGRTDRPLVPLYLSEWGEQLLALPLRAFAPVTRTAHNRISFHLGEPDLSVFPKALWNKYLYAQVRKQSEQPMADAYHTAGHGPLRQAIAQHLGRTRGIRAEPDDIVIVNGSMQAIGLLVQLLVRPGDEVVAENPGYAGFRHSVQAAGGRILAANVDQGGIVPEAWDARLALVTPGRQFPTGCVMTMERRMKLLEWASDKGGILIEDDYDSEFRHRGKPYEPLKVLDEEDRVAFIGTFSKTMPPRLRIGYAVLPRCLREVFIKAKQLLEPHSSSLLEQGALAAMMNSGQYERHLRRMRRVYSRKYSILLERMRAGLPHLFQPVEADAGLHLFAWWKQSPEQFSEYTAACREERVEWSDSSFYYIQDVKSSACFGFSHLSLPDMEEGVERMIRAWHRIK
ncbi:PLP-dependent aminotransferase family protein [Paenibacillus sp. J2TS4]|uniref:MocR-like pyridoxine biosynthesis transcription factor PdxR n=1 Tax=Paenibacillus sp. J2TS4 TaxID=2807194 RepID=UPI001B2CFBEB|nr:PLP-dependent aminotransferase family protein [Paenibacillus sp. J2TS4]GIP31254.1 GntR family transcriptional regulator [Paenibacillus sp. J2TS4]